MGRSRLFFSCCFLPLYAVLRIQPVCGLGAFPPNKLGTTQTQTAIDPDLPGVGQIMSNTACHVSCNMAPMPEHHSYYLETCCRLLVMQLYPPTGPRLLLATNSIPGHQP